MKLLLALIVGAGALVPSMGPRAARHVAVSSSAPAAVEAGTTVIEAPEGLAEFEEALVDDEAWDVDDSGDEDVLADFDLDAVRGGVRAPRLPCSGRAVPSRRASRRRPSREKRRRRRTGGESRRLGG